MSSQSSFDLNAYISSHQTFLSIEIGKLPIDRFVEENHEILRVDRDIHQRIILERNFCFNAFMFSSSLSPAEFQNVSLEAYEKREQMRREIKKLVDHIWRLGLIGPNESFVETVGRIDEYHVHQIDYYATGLSGWLMTLFHKMKVERQKGRPVEPTALFARRLAIRWLEMTGQMPTVTHNAYSETRTGLFVEYTQASRDSLDAAELNESMSAAAENAVKWLKRRENASRSRDLDDS